ncbi:hypothetical protein G9A89_002095 [Geosiphon pyriformis]|nr:hypothetical protein G9A89_002095 [Geosiphon pyriformis]
MRVRYYRKKVSLLHTSTISSDVPLFVNIELASSVAGDSESTFADVYTRSVSYKKLRNPKISVSMVDLSVGLLGLTDIGDIDDKFSKFWSSKMESEASSMGGLSDLKNMKNTATKKTSYANSNNSVINGMEDNTTLRKTCTCTYVLSQPPKAPLFNVLSGNEDMVALSLPKFKGFNQLPSTKSHVSDERKFEPVKSFVLDVELSVVPGKLISDKLVSIKKNFYQVDGFGGASTLSKFLEIIRSSFTSKFSLNKVKVLVINNKIFFNNDLRKINSWSNQEVIIKKIPIDLPRSAVESVFAKFDKIKALVEFESPKVASSVASKWSVLMRKDFVDQHRALLYTLPVGTTAYDLSGLLDLYSVFYCLSLACCAKCKQFGYISDACLSDGISEVHGKRVVTNQNWVHLAGIYKKKQAPIAHPVFFGDRTWAQVAGGFSFRVASLVSLGASLFLVVETFLFASALFSEHDVFGHLASLECSLELLADQVSGILVKLGSIKLVSLATTSNASPPTVLVSVVSGLDLDMVLNDASAVSNLSPLVISDISSIISPSSFKVLTTKVGGLESKIVALEVLVESVLEKLDCLCSDISLARHVCKVSEVPGQLLSIKLFFKNKLSVSILGLYAGTSSLVQFSQAGEVNSLIAKTVNKSSFVVLGGDFNENVIDHNVVDVNKHFNIDHWAVSVSVGLGSLLDTQLNSLYRQANRDCWKFDFKNADNSK